MNTAILNADRLRRNGWVRAAAALSMATGLWALAAGQAQARGSHDDVYWSVGVNSPGVSVGVSNAPPVVVQPRPVVIHQPAPVVVQPAYPYPYVRPVVVHPRPVVYYGGYGPRWDDRHERRHWKHKHRHHRFEHEHEHDRWDDGHRDHDRGGRR